MKTKNFLSVDNLSKVHIIYGIHAVQIALKKHPETISSLLIQSNRQDQRIREIIALAKKNHISIEKVTKEVLQDLIGEGRHQGVLAHRRRDALHASQNTSNLPEGRSDMVCHDLTENDLDQLLSELPEPPFLLILDGVQDPHNLGACLRSADAAGVHAVIAPKDNAVGLTAVARKVACGAAETVPFIQVTNLARVLRKLKKQGIWLFGADERGEQTMFESDLKGPIGLVMGAEGKGLRRLTKEHCDFLVNIPMKGTVSSLNVSVATGVCLFETVRQRHGTCIKI